MEGASTEKGLQTISYEDLARLRRRNAELQILYDTVRDVSSTLSVQHVLERLLDRTLRHLDAEIGSILLVGPDSHLRVVTMRGLPEEVISETRMELGRGISGFVAESGQSLIVDDVEADERFRRRNHERYYTRSLISSPLVMTDSVLGVINVNNKANRTPFVSEDLSLLEAIASHAAIALANAHKYEETLRRAQRDALTGLANHGHFFAILGLEIERAMRYERSLALAMIDIDHFKAYNDRLGHRAGDQALIRVADAVSARSRAHDLVARYGGEEFAIILPETSLEGALAFGEKIRQSVESTDFGPGGAEALTVSVGLAGLPRSGASATALVESADAELYRAKSLGRNRVCPAAVGDGN